MPKSDDNGPKGCFIVMALLCGIMIFSWTSCEVDKLGGFLQSTTHKIRDGWTLKGPLLAIACTLAYPCFAVVAVKISLGLRNWAHFGQVEALSRSEKILMGAFWPLTLLASMIFYIFLGLIDRLFRE